MTTGWTAPSEEDLEAGGDFDTLPEDEYIAVIRSIEVKSDQPNRYPSKNDMGATHDMLVVKMDALTFANGDPLEDIGNNPLESSVPFQVWLNPKKVGMVPQPSKTRKFFAAALGQALGDKIDISDFSELTGVKMIVSLKPNGTYNNAQDFRAIRKSRSRATTPKGPVEGADLANRIESVTDADAPDTRGPLPNQVDDLDF